MKAYVVGIPGARPFYYALTKEDIEKVIREGHSPSVIMDLPGTKTWKVYFDQDNDPTQLNNIVAGLEAEEEAEG